MLDGSSATHPTTPGTFAAASLPARSDRSVLSPARHTGWTTSSGGPENIPPFDALGGV